MIKISALMLAALTGITPVVASEHSSRSLAAGTDTELAPFQWSWMDPVTFNEEGLQRTAAKKDPLRPFFLAFRLLTIYEKTGDPAALKSAQRALDFMLDEYEPANRSAQGTRWFYGFDYDRGIKAPWWSGMDGFFGPMTLFAAWQVTGNERYRSAALQSAKLMLRQPSEGGVLWRDGKSCWISEYSWNGITRDQEYHVLNGHLWGLQALFMLANASGEKDLKEAYQCARQGTIDRLPNYYNQAGNWTWYQLVPKVINPTHYNTIEIAQFRAMEALTGDPVYKEPAMRRSAIFKNTYPLSLIDTPTGLEVQFSMMGAPNAYWTDTYPVTVSCTIGKQTVTQKNADAYNTKKPLAERMILRLPVSGKPDHCEVSIHSNVDVKMYNQNRFTVLSNIKEDNVNPIYTVALQAKALEDGNVRVTPMSGESAKPGEGRILLNINRNVSISEKIALIVHSTGNAQLGMVLEDAKGKRATSYYPALQAGKDNIVIFNKLGLNNGSELDENLKELALRVYTKPNEKPLDVQIKEIQIIRNPANLESFFKRNASAHFPQQ